jgi:hypothetical protein
MWVRVKKSEKMKKSKRQTNTQTRERRLEHSREMIPC